MRNRKLLMALLMAALTLITAAAASGWSTQHLQPIYVQEDGFENYDFATQSLSSTNVEWPATLLFWNDASKLGVRNGLNPWYNYSGSTEYGRLDDGPSWFWNGDGGRKNIVDCTSQTDTHYRIYANPSNDYNYNVTYGYYVVGTSHEDHAECGAGTWYGYSENAEHNIANHASTLSGWSVNVDSNYWYNPESLRQEGSHIWQSDGYRTGFKVP
jgi:hypothetical protein